MPEPCELTTDEGSIQVNSYSLYSTPLPLPRCGVDLDVHIQRCFFECRFETTSLVESSRVRVCMRVSARSIGF